MVTLNAIMAVLAIFGGLLCARAFLPYVDLFGPRPTDNLARGILISALAAFPRIFYWDVFRNFADIWPMAFVNVGFNVLLIAGVYFILRASWMVIPKGERDQYNIITGVFYPKKNIMPRLRGDK